MDLEQKLIIGKISRKLARILGLLVSIGVIIFALITNPETGDDGTTIGFIKNIPHAAPWLFLLLIVWISWKWELAGGVMITSLGGLMIYFFHVHSFFSWLPFIFILLILLIGILFIISWLMRDY